MQRALFCVCMLATPRLPPCLTTCLSAGLLNILGPVLLLLLALFSNSPTPPAALHFSRSYPMQMFTEWNSVPYYVKDRGGFVKEYPSHSIKRQKFEHMVLHCRSCAVGLERCGVSPSCHFCPFRDAPNSAGVVQSASNVASDLTDGRVFSSLVVAVAQLPLSDLRCDMQIEQEWKSEVQQSCNFERMKERELHRRTRSRNRSAPLPHVPKPSCDKLRDFHSGIRADSRSRESLADSDRVIHDEF